MTATSARETIKRANCFDFLRLFAALCVVVAHATTHLDVAFLWYESGSGQWFLDGVPMFFILSGLFVYRSAEKCRRDQRPWREFYRNRALRVVPALYLYTVVVIAGLLIVGIISAGEALSGGFLAFLASNVLLVPVYHPAVLSDFGVGVLNGSLWTIPVEVSFYVVVPVIVILLAKAGRFGMAALGIVAGAGVLLYGVTGGAEAAALVWKLYGVTFLAWLWYFTLGIFWARNWDRAPQSGWLAALGVLGYAAGAWIREGVEAGPAAIVTAVAAVPLSYATVWFGYNAPRALSRLTRGRDYSFGAYIWHMIVVNVLVEYGARGWAIPGTALVLVVMALTLALAALSWHLVESKALRMKRYSVRRSTTEVGAPVRTP